MGVDAQMFVKLRDRRVTPVDVKRLAWEAGEAFGHKRFWIFKPDQYGREEFRPALSIIDAYEQDGPTIEPEPNEQFIEVHPATRFYGIDYERGDLPFLLALAEWLEAKLPGCEVWYGGDSSGCCAELFDASARRTLFAHFVAHGHRPYNGSFMRGAGDFGGRVCPYCDEPMNQYGFGGNGQYASYTCDGCGEQTETRDAGLTWHEPKEDRALA